MASFAQNKYCSNCKKNVITTKNDPTHCPVCGGAISLRDWTVRFRVMENGKIKNKRLSGYTTKKDAQNAYAKFLVDYDPKTQKRKKILLYDDLLKEHLAIDKTQTAPATYYDKQAVFAKFISPIFTGKKLDTLTKTDYLLWQDTLWKMSTRAGKVLSHKYKSKIRGYFSKFLTYCEDRYNLTNYFYQIKMPKNTDVKKEMQIIEIQEFNLLLNEVDKDSLLNYYQKNLYKTIFMFLFYLGARINEILALKLTDIDLELKIVSFNKSVSRKLDKIEFPTQYYIVKQTKNNKSRKNIMPDILVEQLKIFLNCRLQNGEFLFGDKNPLHDKVVTRVKNKYLELSNLPHMRLHDFRHSHVSFLLHIGVSFPVIAQRIGDTLDVVVKTYSHMYKNDEVTAILELDKYVEKIKCT